MRDYQDIIAQILNCAQRNHGLPKTRLMYEVRLSFSQVKGYLKYLQQVELLSYDEESRVFRTTRKGKNFLELYNGMAELISGRKREKYADTDNI